MLTTEQYDSMTMQEQIALDKVVSQRAHAMVHVSKDYFRGQKRKDFLKAAGVIVWSTKSFGANKLTLMNNWSQLPEAFKAKCDAWGQENV